MNIKKVLAASVSLAAMTLGTAGVAFADTSQASQQPQAQTAYSYNSKTQPTTTNVSTTSSSSNSAVVNTALKLTKMNIPYVWGGESLRGMDCSGLTDYVYKQATGKSLGHYTVTQEGKVTKEAVSAAQPGDLLFWGAQGASYHVALYIGNGQFVAAPQPGQNVQVQSLSDGFAGHVN